MSIVIRQWRDGKLHPVDYTAGSLGEAAKHEPDDGVYTVANTVNRYDVLRLTAHLDRLRDSARREGIELTLPDDVLRGALREVITGSGYDDVRFRLTVSRAEPNAPIISVEPYAGYPPALYSDGVHVATAPNSARHNPESKDTAWMRQREALRAKSDAYEVILTDSNGYLLEGTSSNFYAIVDGKLYTALEGVLGGISRGTVFEIALDVLPLVKEPIHRNRVEQIEEAFITSSSRGIMPVVQIDGVTVGDGSPGPLTKQLRAAYLEWVGNHMETL